MHESDFDAKITTKYKNIHNEIMSKLNIMEKAKRDAPIAAEMQQVLYQIKNLSNQDGTPLEKVFREQAITLIERSVSLLNITRGESKAKKFKATSSGAWKQGEVLNSLFHRAHDVKTTYGGDDILEEEFAALMSSIELEASNTVIDVSSHLAGGNSANINLLNNKIDKDIETILKKAQKKIKAKAVKDLTKPNKFWGIPPVARSGKIDTTGTSVTIEANLNSQWEHMFNLFKGRTFSLKNYSSFSKNTSLNITLGDSNYYKAIYATLSSLGHSHEYIEKVIYSSINSILKNQGGNSSSVATHFYHLRFIYELQGNGLYDSNGEPISGVDFIIYNDPSTANIYVKSTAELIYEELTKNNNIKNPLSAVHLAKSRFQ